MKLTTALALILAGAARLNANDHDANSAMADCPMMKSADAMNERGDKGMGFSQDKTTHHFRLTADGGAIEVAANDASDEKSRTQIRGHLSHVAKLFQEGNFEIPMFVHDKVPDGAPVMQREKANIRFTFEETENGGRVLIKTGNAEALKAIHQFLRFQITEHQTGDSTEIGGKS